MSLSAVWMLGLLAAFLALLWRKPDLRVPRHAVLLLFLLALTVRLTPSALLARQGNFDIQSFRLVGETLGHRTDVYTHPDTFKRYPYLPLQMLWMLAAARLSVAAGMPFPFTVRLLPILVDALIPLAILSLLRRKGDPRAWRAGLLYALNPVSVFVSACHGQFDALPAALALLALTDPSAPRGALWLGLGILDKSWPVLAWPLWVARLRAWRKRALYTLLMGSIPLLAVAFYALFLHAPATMALKRALSYNHGIGIWGYTYLLRLLLPQPAFWRFTSLARWVTLGALALIWWQRARHRAPAAGFLDILLGFLALGHAFSIQYLLWPLPFAALAGEEHYLGRYVLAAFAYMFLAYYTLIFHNTITNLLPWPQADLYLIILAGLPAWLVTVAWLRVRWRQS
ncbi:MAG: hypothetical protein Fur0018_01630 [Anaerolineales bacterium]